MNKQAELTRQLLETLGLLMCMESATLSPNSGVQPPILLLKLPACSYWIVVPQVSNPPVLVPNLSFQCVLLKTLVKQGSYLANALSRTCVTSLGVTQLGMKA